MRRERREGGAAGVVGSGAGIGALRDRRIVSAEFAVG
jgi:hypothetical protein